MARGIPFAQPPPEQGPPSQRRARVRLLWALRRNPLRRRSDVLRAWVGLAVLLAVAVAAPAAAVLSADLARRHYTRVAHEQAATGHETTAVLLHDSPGHPEPGSAEADEARYPVEVRFTDPHGRVRTAQADVLPHLSTGSRVQVWAAADGTLADPPPTAAEIANRSKGCAVIAVLAVHLTGGLVYGVTHRLVQRRNLAAWEAAWARTAARWTNSP
ncbi:hypothetical protein [Streptomyces sp. Da 82-17]|uniref:Rv1733c family protein n=1 Tax=Streptomyces sp. Da 82-17 TaxID=3377116 RepID=UPI0038D37A16